MRSLIVLCLVSVAFADELGYNYKPVGHSEGGLSFQPNSGAGGYGSASNLAPSLVPRNEFPLAQNEAPSYTPQTEFEKEFFTYSANENDFNDPAALNSHDNSIKQGLRVIFIKGPENTGLENAAIHLAKQANEQKTDIYVLQKQADLSNLANKLNVVNENNNNKPEVHFVKYRTPEDASNAQKAIQGQYDSLGGLSQSHDGGVAPVLNFASSAPAPVSSHNIATPVTANTDAIPSSSYLPPVSTTDEPSNAYLPASILRLFRL